MAKQAKWTVMVLMGANNILKNEAELTKFAEDDLKEMEKVGSRPGILNIVVQIDRKPDDGGPGRFFIAQNKRQDVGPIPEGQGGSGNSRVLEYFLRWAKKKYPADHYLLVLWGHAYRLAFNRDPRDPEGLDFPTLAAAIRKTNSGGKKTDIVGFDSCNAGLFEAAFELRDVADYFVASQFTDPLPGWPYDTILDRILTDRNYKRTRTYLAESTGPKDLGRAIVSQFVRNYRGKDSATMTMLDLSEAEGVANQFEELGDALTSAVYADPAELERAREIFQRCQVPGPHPIGQPSVDLMTFCWHLANFSGSEEVRIAAAAVGDSLLLPGGAPGNDGENSFIAAHGGNDLVVAMLHGVSAFAPNLVSNDGFDLGSLRAKYLQLEFAKRSRWGELVFALAERDSS